MSWRFNDSKRLSGLAVVLCALIVSSCDKNLDIEINSKEGRSGQLFAGDSKSISDFRNDLAAHDKYWTYIHSARAYIKAGEYGKAEAEYHEAIKASRGDGDKWMARYALKDLYVKSWQLDKALEEIDWLVGNTGRADVIQKLNIEKERILKSTRTQ